MADKSWKQWERAVAKLVGGKRRGPDFRGEDGGKNDIIHPHFSIECKLLSRPSYGHLLDAALEAERNAKPDQEPVAIVKRKGRSCLVGDALVVMRLETWLQWRIGAHG